MAENKRMKIVALKQASHNSKDVAKMVSVDLKTVFNVIKRFNDTGTTVSKPKCGKNVQIVQKLWWMWSASGFFPGILVRV